MHIENLLPAGLVAYTDVDKLQREIWQRVREGKQDHTLILAQFQPVYTAGRNTHETDLVDKSLPVIRTDRAGSLTWHGPGQLVVYPVVKLRQPLDLVSYIRAVEASVVDAVRGVWGLPAETIAGRAGVWLRYRNATGTPASERHDSAGVRAGQDRKVCAIGLKVVRGTTLHGLALNLCPDFSSAFSGIIPCGLSDAGVTSLQEEGVETDIHAAAETLVTHLVSRLTPLLTD